ncbi:hypothetical protein GQ457_08G016490 [Hibiscus cannabinus]
MILPIVGLLLFPQIFEKLRKFRFSSLNLRNKKISIDPSEFRYYEDDDTLTMKTIKGATIGFDVGTIWGTLVATWYVVPRVDGSVALPWLVRTLKMMENYGMKFSVIGGVYIGGDGGGFVARASILGFKGVFRFARISISTTISTKVDLAIIFVVIDVGGQTTRIDTDRVLPLHHLDKTC